MFSKSTLDFLTGLQTNNNKPWFDANRPAYEAAKKDIENFTQTLLAGLEFQDADIANAHLKPKDCVMRIFRDVRFSADKTPYKSNFFGYFTKTGRKGVHAGYYFCVEPGGKSFFGGGVYMPMSPELAKIRQEIAYCLDEWREIVTAPAFLQEFPAGIKTEGTLNRPPQGYAADHPAIEYLKMKGGYFTSRELADAEMTAPDLKEKILTGFRAVMPLVKFVNRSLD